MNIALGQSGIVLGLLGAVAGAVTLLLGLVRRRPNLVRASQPYVWLVLAGAVVATIAMQRALITHDFTLAYVDNNDSTFTPLLYRITAMWSSLAGSILLWVLVLSCYLGAMWVRYRKRADEPFVLWAKLSGYGVATFFFALMLLASNPFDRAQGVVPTQGPGPDPLLQDRVLVAFHPPLLYMGLVGFTIPFCLAVASLVTGRSGSQWLAETRRWSLFPWACLTGGLVLGAWWSYQVLGWGGYWSWDPVENSALLPWLTATAFLHSAVVQQQRAMLKVWNLALVLATFSLTMLGTFFTRSGVLESVHSFTNDGGVGPALLGFFGLVVAVSLGLLAWRGDALRGRAEPTRAVSREGAFFANNLVFSAFALVVLVGTVFPLVVQAVNGQTATVGMPFFDTMTMPLVVCLLFLMAVAPALPWRHAKAELLQRRLLWPAVGAVTVVVACVLGGARGLWPLVVFGLGAFAAGSALRQLVLTARRGGLAALAGRTGGGMIVHVGIVVIAVAFAASHAYAHSQAFSLKNGQAVTYQGDRLVFRGMTTVQTPGSSSEVAKVELDGHYYYPAVKQFAMTTQAVPSPAVQSTPVRDVYMALTALPAKGSPAQITVTVQPLVIWLWTGGLISVLGGVVALLPSRGRRRPAAGPALPVEADADLPVPVGAPA